MTSIVVFGGTGYAGSAITREALSRGIAVTAVARDTSKLDAAEGLTLAQGDAFDADFVADVTKGADVVVVALHAVQADGSELKDKFQHFVDAAAAAGARLGIVGGAGSLLVAEGGPALFDTPDFPDAFKGEAKSHAEVLEALKASGTEVDWFYVSPAAAFRILDRYTVSRACRRCGVTGAVWTMTRRRSTESRVRRARPARSRRSTWPPSGSWWCW